MEAHRAVIRSVLWRRVCLPLEVPLSLPPNFSGLEQGLSQLWSLPEHARILCHMNRVRALRLGPVT